MKKFVALLLAALMVVALFAACTTEPETPDVDTPVVDDPVEETEGKVFNIYVWNTEFKEFFEIYYEGTRAINWKAVEADASVAPVYYEAAPGVPEGVTVEFIINTNEGGVYQTKLDEALLNQESAAADEKIDMFLAEADYILKYVETDYTMDITELGFENADTMYEYTIKAASDQNGVCKGVSFQCCPAALIYRRSIAEDVLGTSDPAEVQAQLDSWEKFEAVAATAKEKGYYMTASYAETYRTFSNNCTTAWVDADKNLVFDDGINAWIEQTKNFMDNGYTLSAGVWDDEKNQQMFADGKTMCFFGPAWYFNFSMGNAQDAEKGCYGDWAICQGPQAYFWGGTWLLAATGTDNPTMLKEIFEMFTVDEDVVSSLVADQQQYPNNTAVAEKFAADTTYGNAFLGGQNDIAMFADMAEDIKWEYHTQYDQLLNEGLQAQLKDYFTGELTLEEALANFYKYVNETYPAIVTP